MTGIRGFSILRLVVAFAALIVAACTTPQGQVAAPAGPADEYQVGSGDKIRVTVFGADRLSGEFTVDPDGSIYMPLIGSVPVRGQTLTQVAGGIGKRLKDANMVDKPEVIAGLIEARPYYIYGEVTRSGSYPFQPGMNVLSAIATAGGFTYRAAEDRVYIRRGGTGGEQTVDLTNTSASPMPIRPGDIIRVPGRFF